MGAEEVPDWVIPPYGGFTAEHFLRMYGLPRRTELIDGGLIFRRPQEKWHRHLIDLLQQELNRQAHAGLRGEREMAVCLGEHQVPEPDVLVVTADAYTRSEPSTHYVAEDVVLAVEVVSPDTRTRDRDTKPRRSAAAGIPHFWLIENEGGKPLVKVYQRDIEASTYALHGIYHDRLTLAVPFAIDIDLTALD